jgi:flagellar biosynthesis protein FliP
MLVLTSIFLFDIKTAFVFSFINAFTHLFIDYVTSRIIIKMGEGVLNKKVINIKEFDISTISVYWPVLVLGLDQLAHHFILIYSLRWLC